MGRRKHRFENRKEPEVEFFENFRRHFNGSFPRRFARKRDCRFCLNLAAGCILNGGTTLGASLPEIIVPSEF